jgi:hypothetical protein
MIVPKKGNYALLENVRVSYDPTKDAIYLTSKDPDLPSDKGGFRLTLNGSSKEEQMLREMLTAEGVIDTKTQLPTTIPAPPSKTWDEFPIGVNRNPRGEEIREYWNPYKDSHLTLLGSPGSGKSNMINNLISHASQYPEQWRVHSIDFAQTTTDKSEYLEKTVELLQKLVDEVESRLQEMNREGITRYDKIPNGQSVLVLIDSFSESGGLKLANPSDSSLIELGDNELRNTGVQLLERLTSVGRQAGVFVVISSYSVTGVPLGLLCRFPSQIVTRMTAQESVFVTGKAVAAKLPTSPGRAWYHRSGTGRIIQGYLAK